MTPPGEPAAASTGPAVIPADDTCAGVFSQVIAGAFHDLAVSRWLIPGPAARRRERPGSYHQQLTAVTGPWADRFRAFSQKLDRRRPAGLACHHLAILAVRPDRQGQGLGTALLRARHAVLDRDGIPAYLQAADMRSRRVFRAEGYDHGGLVFLPGAVMHPMVRQPRTGGPARETPARAAASAGQEPQPAPGGTR